jgi:hypothetical protein
MHWLKIGLHGCRISRITETSMKEVFQLFAEAFDIASDLQSKGRRFKCSCAPVFHPSFYGQRRSNSDAHVALGELRNSASNASSRHQSTAAK